MRTDVFASAGADAAVVVPDVSSTFARAHSTDAQQLAERRHDEAGDCAAASTPAAPAPIVFPRRGKLHGYEFFASLGSPRRVCAPMVEGSELAFRALTRSYGAQLAYTPMINAFQAATAQSFVDGIFSTAPEDRPLIAQFAGDDPATLERACARVQAHVDAVDLNFGCPQGIAKRGHYGAFLLDEPELVFRLVRRLHECLSVPVTAKIRVLPTYEATRALILGIQDAGASLITVHARTRQNMKQSITGADWDILRRLRADPAVTIPLLANGSIATREDIEVCLAVTGCDGVMVSEALLENPALFQHSYADVNPAMLDTPGAPPSVFTLARQYVNFAVKYGMDRGTVRGHLMKIMFSAVAVHHDMRDRIVAHDWEVPAAISIIDVLEQRWRESQRERARKLAADAQLQAAESALLAQLHDEWLRVRERDPTAGVVPPSCILDYGVPGRWYVRYRRDVYQGLCVTGAHPALWTKAGKQMEELTLTERLQRFRALAAAGRGSAKPAVPDA